MKTFITDDFLLQNKTARALYHDYAESAPIFDYHCHLDPQQILENTRFPTITHAWLMDDHYKWRLMRANGVPEQFVTGNADPKEKFFHWADTISRAIGNPLYHWSNLELLRYFGIDTLLTPDTAQEIWETANARLLREEMRVRSLIVKSNVKKICTTDDPIDSLEVHRKLKTEFPEVQILPTFRTDRVLHPELPGCAEYLRKLNPDLSCMEDLKATLSSRAAYFAEHGCVLADQSMDAPDFTCRDAIIAETALQKILKGEPLSDYEYNCYQTELTFFLGELYCRHGFTMQLHLCVTRNLNTALFERRGVDMGGDAIGASISSKSLVALLDGLAKKGTLPKTILYPLNPADTTRLMTLCGSFQEGNIRSKLQVGSAWWFNDHKEGIEAHLTAFANTGILSSFIGMLTDSRSFLSYARHEYFRRVLCNLLGTWAEDGLLPNHLPYLGKIVNDICYNNACSYFGQ
ncbi:MAG: glucuronate isomerase [Oscillospiraceae bacterium]|nr:glucuronate isomerase [Oscillospiraceae bacterium]